MGDDSEVLLHKWKPYPPNPRNAQKSTFVVSRKQSWEPPEHLTINTPEITINKSDWTRMNKEEQNDWIWANVLIYWQVCNIKPLHMNISYKY